MEFVHFPMSLVASIIRPEIFSIPIYCILGPTPFVLCAVLPLENALSMLHALLEFANVVAAISQHLNFVNPQFFRVNQTHEEAFREHIQQEMSSEQLSSNYYQKLFGPQI